ncbi:DUF2163 domain-containing protein [Acuticoccus sp.]|uniref:DUF2163 domain-containing protein n=1 Tax=Acuticoccus sp. TaxID=1904378 RepID=UPI003B525921
MRAIPGNLQAHLSVGVTTLCRCWQVERTDGVVLGFTDHDGPVAFDGIVHSAMSGLASTGDVTRTGLGVGGLEIAGALSSAGLDAGELESGWYDFARVRLWLVNWADVTERVLLRSGTLGEVTREDGAFRAEVRGPAQALETVRGRVFTHACDADLGDERCRVDLAALAREATVIAVNGPRVTVEGLVDAHSGTFFDGSLQVLTGEAVGARAAIAVHGRDVHGTVLRLRTAVLRLASGDVVRLSAGCDKRFATCRDRYSNTANYQGFPHLPGNDRAFAYARGNS